MINKIILMVIFLLTISCSLKIGESEKELGKEKLYKIEFYSGGKLIAEYDSINYYYGNNKVCFKSKNRLIKITGDIIVKQIQ